MGATEHATGSPVTVSSMLAAYADRPGRPAPVPSEPLVLEPAAGGAYLCRL